MGIDERWRVAVRPASGPLVAWRLVGRGRGPMVPPWYPAERADTPNPRLERVQWSALLRVAAGPDGPARSAWLVRPIVAGTGRRIWCRTGATLYPAGIARPESIGAIPGGGAAAVVPLSGHLRPLVRWGWVDPSRPWAELVASVACCLCRGTGPGGGGPAIGCDLVADLARLGAAVAEFPSARGEVVRCD